MAAFSPASIPGRVSPKTIHSSGATLKCAAAWRKSSGSGLPFRISSTGTITRGNGKPAAISNLGLWRLSFSAITVQSETLQYILLAHQVMPGYPRVIPWTPGFSEGAPCMESELSGATPTNGVKTLRPPRWIPLLTLRCWPLQPSEIPALRKTASELSRPAFAAASGVMSFVLPKTSTLSASL